MADLLLHACATLCLKFKVALLMRSYNALSKEKKVKEKQPSRSRGTGKQGGLGGVDREVFTLLYSSVMQGHVEFKVHTEKET